MPGGWGSLDDDETDHALAAANGHRQARVVLRLVRQITATDERLVVTPPLICGLHRIAMDGLVPSAGTFRPDGWIVPLGGLHDPPPYDEVPTHIDDLCSYLAMRWDADGPLPLAAYTLWRLNWIHPFTDGNGRTSRALAYLVLSAKFGFVLPGRHPIPDRIKYDSKRYYDALSAADEACRRGTVDVGAMQSMLHRHLLDQLTDKPLRKSPDKA